MFRNKYPQSYLEATMARTFHPKYASYTGDGSGRDTYVVLNNGGLTNSDKPNMMFRKQAYQQKHLAPRPEISPASHKYHSDGTGRDSYVVNNFGGLVHDYNGVHN
jgi:hypothetical protein